MIPRNATVLHTTWSPPPLDQRNGLLTGYIVELTDTQASTTRRRQTNGTTFQWDSLHPDYVYRCRVAATTEAGTGLFTQYVSVQMPEAGSYTHVCLSGYQLYGVLVMVDSRCIDVW